MTELRVTNQDRDQVVEHVQVAFAEGRLDKDEMEERLGRAMNARTHSDLAPIMADLYGSGPAVVDPAPRHPAHHSAHAGPWGRSAHVRRADFPPAGVTGRRDGDLLGGAAAHLLSLGGLFLIGPLIMLLTAGKTSPYVRSHAVEALNFHLTLLGATLLLPFTIVGVILIPVIWVVAFVLSVVGGLAALTEGGFRYPLTVRLIN
jgi:uncharacterized Tic20 family protein